MKERPILFSSAMVRALLDGRKTQTRRVLKVPNHPAVADWVLDSEFRATARAHSEEVARQYVTTFPYGRVRCKYGKPGDRLWVRETRWRSGGYAATDKARYENCGKVAAIHMPRWASRITLEVTGVRVERLQAISEADAKAEGVEPYRCPQADALMNAVGGGMKPIPYTSGFANLWNEVNGKTYPWSSNCWVWVVEFKVVPA